MAWSDAARAAALQARQMHGHGKGAYHQLATKGFYIIPKTKYASGYRGKYPDHIKSVASGGKNMRGIAHVITNAGARFAIHAKDTGGMMPKVGTHISNYIAHKR